MKNHYYVIMREYEGKQNNFVLRCSESENLYSKLSRFNGIIVVNPFSTKKKACEVADLWNEWAVENGNSLFDRVYPAANCIYY